MENAADALKIVLAIIMFVVAITITFMSISRAKATSDIVIYELDETNFYTAFEKFQNGDIVTIRDTEEPSNLITEYDNFGNRIVGADVIISTLYRYYKESFCITILNSNGSKVGRFDPAYEGSSPWRGSEKNTELRIDAFINGNNAVINTVNCIFGGESGQRTGNSDGSYYLAEEPFDRTKKYKEEFVEVVNSGIYDMQDDGSQITLTPGGKTIYITYTEI